MPQIRILPVGLRNKIAAGEVIERPASVVKELVENALDAGSTDIRVDILKSGKLLIKVSDNGSGMDSDDARLCFERHATSKLKDEADLFDIRTLGFRGEALPSIASISNVKLITGRRQAKSGLSLIIHGGELREVKDAPAVGTSVEVRDLFFNTPARRKFLKSDSTELFHIIDAITKEALSHWDVGFSLFAEHLETMRLPGASDARERIQQIYGSEFVDGLLETAAEERGISVSAFVSKTENFRKGRAHQYIFINGRPIKDTSVSHAVYKAFEGILPADRHPVYFLYLNMDPQRVDFNVHPAKREVRFENTVGLHDFIRMTLRDAVRRHRGEHAASFSETHDLSPQAGQTISVTPGRVPSAQSGLHPQPTPPWSVAEVPSIGYQAALPFLYLGDTFIAASGRGGLTLIDHHAAHERILYERFLKGIGIDSNQLLFPRQVKLSHKEYTLILKNRDLLGEMGIEADDFGHDTVMVRSLPDALKEADLRGILADIACAIEEGKRPDQPLKESLAARIACHSSVRGKAILSQEEFQRLLTDLGRTEHPDQCPHGRPTRIFLSLDDLKKMFKRK